MQCELDSFKANDAWELVKLPKGKKTIDTKWVFKTKFNSDGTIDCHKARLVARGFRQNYGTDYKEIFLLLFVMQISDNYLQ